MIIGVSGYARSGKDTIGQILVNEFDFHRIAFADILKEAIEILNPYVKWGLSTVRIRDVIESIGREKAKEEIEEYRRLLQVFGTEVGRELLGEDVWVNAAFARMRDDRNYVVTDVRFPNEFRAVHHHAGEIWRVSRPGVGPANAHRSETALDSSDFIPDVLIHNDGTIEDLQRQVTSHLIEARLS
jgi:hypothetical protein